MRLSNNQQAFLSLLRAGLWENKMVHDARLMVRDCLDVDWEEVYRMAAEQSVLGLVLAGVDCLPNDQKPPKLLLLQWIGEIQMLEQQNKEMNCFIGELVEKLRTAGIYTLLVKGQGIAQCYDRPLWRSCGDIDLYLSDDSYQKAKELLIPIAVSVAPEGVYEKHLALSIDNWSVELHGYLRCGLSARMDKGLDELHNDVFCSGNVRSWLNDKTQVFLPGANCDVLFVFTHFIKHFYLGGLGFRQICDWIRLLWTYRSELDLRLLESRIKRMGLMSEWKVFGTFAVEYLGMPFEAMPFYSQDEKMKRKADRIFAFIMEVGNMGHNREGYRKYSYVIRKAKSLGRRCGDLMHHSMIFPMDSLRFFPNILFHGLSAAARGE